MKKFLSLVTLLLCAVVSVSADEAVISWYMGANGAAATSANSITGASGCAAEGFTIAITGNTSKNWSNGNGDITYSAVTYKTLKNSNGAQNTITCPTGKVATQVVFYVTTNDDKATAKLTEIDGTACSDEVSSQKNYTSPTVITKSIASKSSFTFTFSTKQVCFLAVVTYTDAPSDVVANPVITQTGNTVSMSCGTTGAKIYYTTNGEEPTTSSTLYSSEITLDNSCTIRAKAFNGSSDEYYSEIVKKECYVTHATAIAVLGYNGGTVSGDVWTSTGGVYTITNNVADRGIGYTNLAGSQDGFKLNHTDSYTIQPAEGVKVTKLAVVGKTWLQGDAGNASTIAFDDFTPASGTFYDYLTDGETYVKSIEFTPSTEQTFGQAITMRPGNNQVGAYIEVYGELKTFDVTYDAGANGTGTVAAGEKKYGKAFSLSSSTFTRAGYVQTGWATSDGGAKVYELGGSYTANADITLYPVWATVNVINSWDFTNWSDATKTDMLANTEKWNQYERTGNGGTDFGDDGRSNIGALSNNTLTSTAIIAEANGLKFTAPAYGLGVMFNLPSTSIGTYHGSQYIWLYGNTSTIKIPSVPANATIEIGVESHKDSEARGVTLKNGSTTLTQTQGDATSMTYQVCKWTNTSTEGDVVVTPSKGLHIYYITVTENVEVVTAGVTAYGWATFCSDKALDFTGITDVKAYVVTNHSEKAIIKTQVTGAVKANTPLLLEGATTEIPVATTTGTDYSGTNKLHAGNGTTDGVAWESGKTKYVLGVNTSTNEAEFQKIVDGTPATVPVGKAYLEFGEVISAPALSFFFEDEIVTGVNDVRSKVAEVNGEVYNLNGQRVSKPAKGLYIVNGKKVVIK